MAILAFSDGGYFWLEIECHAAIKDIKAALPQTLVAEFLSVSNDPTLQLVDLGKAAIEHRR